MDIPPELKVFIISMSPVGELRASIPIGIGLFKMTWKEAFLFSFIGNSLAVIVGLLLLDKVVNFLSVRSRLLFRLFEWIFDRTKRKYENRFKVWKELALIFFVAIPLPGTGGWTGVVCAYLFGIPYRRAIPSIVLGIFFAGVITTLCTLGIIKLI